MKIEAIKLYIIISLVATAIILSLTQWANAEDKIATGASGGTYFTVGNDIVHACPDLGLSVSESNGTLSNISRVFTDNSTIFFIGQLDGLYLKSIQEKAKMSKIVVVAPMFGEEIHCIARNGINGLEDLRGKRVVVGIENSGTWVTAKMIQNKTGVTFKEYYADPKVSMNALIRGDVDAVFYVSGAPVKALIDVGKEGDGIIHLVNLKHSALDTTYSISDIPEGTYPWQEKAVSTYAVKSVLATYNYTSEKRRDQVRRLAECLKAKKEELDENGHPKWKAVDFNAEVRWQMHPDAKQVFGR